jgi:hypothetical protein
MVLKMVDEEKTRVETGGYYIVDEGTNMRACSKGKSVGEPNIYDTAQIAQKHIDDDVDYRRRAGIIARTKRVPISIAEYRKKYSTDEED